MAEDSEEMSSGLSLAQWLAALEDPDAEPIWRFAFPSNELRAEYLDSIANRSDDEVRALLRRLLMPTGRLGSDEFRVLGLEHLRSKDADAYEANLRRESIRRLLDLDGSGEPPWQGLTWILDLLPRWPMQAIDVLEAYFLAHMLYLPDQRINGIEDIQAVIRAMWIGNPVSGTEKLELVFQLGPRRFERLIESLYAEMGFQTTLTAPGNDGGRDVIATTDLPGEKQRTLIECKLWREPVGRPVAQKLLGAVSNERSTKGVIATTDRFTGPAERLASENSRIELLGWDALLQLLDRYLGAAWGRYVDTWIARSVRRTGDPE